MRFFVFGVYPATSEGPSVPTPAAYVSCWINEECRDVAELKARTVIEKQGWKIATLVDDYPIGKEDYSDKPEGLEYYEQALVDGEVVVFFVPKEPDGNRPEKGTKTG